LVLSQTWSSLFWYFHKRDLHYFGTFTNVIFTILVLSQTWSSLFWYFHKRDLHYNFNTGNQDKLWSKACTIMHWFLHHTNCLRIFEGIVHDSFYNLLCLTSNNQVGWYGCSGGNCCLHIQDWSYHVVWEVCVTDSKEWCSSHLQGGTYYLKYGRWLRTFRRKMLLPSAR